MYACVLCTFAFSLNLVMSDHWLKNSPMEWGYLKMSLKLNSNFVNLIKKNSDLTVNFLTISYQNKRWFFSVGISLLGEKKQLFFFGSGGFFHTLAYTDVYVYVCMCMYACGRVCLCVYVCV